MALVLALVFRRPAAARAAGGGARRGRADVRADGAGRRAADDGLDRGAAGAARPRRRLRDPVPGADPGSRRPRPARRGAARAAVPTIATAALATAAGFLVLLLSPVPMVRGFGVLLVAGVGIAFALALTGGTAALVALGAAARAGRRRCGARRRGRASELRRRGRAAARRGWLRRGAAPASACCAAALARPGARARASALAARRARLGRRHADRGALRPAGSSSRRTCRRCATSTTLQRTTGVAGEVDVVVEGDDLDRPGGRRVDARATRSACSRRRRYSRRQRLRQGGAVPGALAARPVPGRATRRPTARASTRCSTPCRRTSPRPSSPPTGGPRTSPSASG